MSASLAVLAHHEARLGWRDLIWMLTAGRRRRAIRILFGAVVVIGALHWMSYAILVEVMHWHATQDTQSLIVISASILLAWMLMLSQAMESVTRGFYTRGDLDLILSSPVSSRRVFALRVMVIALLVSFMSVLLVGPVVNVLALSDSWHWLAGYGVALAMGLSATALAVVLTVALFHLAGPRRTRLIAQIIAAVVGAGFVIGIQTAAILTTGNYSRTSFLRSPWMLTHAPMEGSAWWLPARAVMGDLSALGMLLGAAFVFYAALTMPLLGRFAHYATAAVGVGQGKVTQKNPRSFRPLTRMQAMRQKEWQLIRRDPWLVSQTLMQLLYLLPPALLMWKNYADNGHGVLVLVPVLVMAAGQLAGGVTWITICGEDAPDLVATAPLSARQLTRAKLQAVLRVVTTVFLPLTAVLALESPWGALVSIGGILVATFSSALIQLWFRAQAKRSSFRRRHAASRIATFAEAFCCIGWAATAALVAGHSVFALATALFALFVLGIARLLRPNKPKR